MNLHSSLQCGQSPTCREYACHLGSAAVKLSTWSVQASMRICWMLSSGCASAKCFSSSMPVSHAGSSSIVQWSLNSLCVIRCIWFAFACRLRRFAQALVLLGLQVKIDTAAAFEDCLLQGLSAGQVLQASAASSELLDLARVAERSRRRCRRLHVHVQEANLPDTRELEVHVDAHGRLTEDAYRLAAAIGLWQKASTPGAHLASHSPSVRGCAWSAHAGIVGKQKAKVINRRKQLKRKA